MEGGKVTSPELELRVLGPVKLWSGRVIDVGPPKQQCVLAALGMSAGVAVSAGTLIDRVWGAEQPRDARNALQTYIARLRRLLDGDVPGGSRAVLRRTAAGYLLDIDRERVDAHRFRAAVARARHVGGDEERRALLAEALRLWRGVPLDGPTGDWAEAVRAGLVQSRVNALIDRVEVDLRHGAGPELIDELAGLLIDHPLTEHLACQLMLALWRAGRATEALEVYERTRKNLAEAFGNDPGPQLRRLHQQILRQDPQLDAPLPAVWTDTRAADTEDHLDGEANGSRWQVEPPYRGLWPFQEGQAEMFYGRDRLTRELADHVEKCLHGPGALVVTGASGAGKSSLLRAGLLPAIARGRLPVPSSQDWPRLIITPTSSPLDELAAHLAAAAGADAVSARRALLEEPERTHLLARQAVLAHAATLPAARRDELRAHGRMTLVVDQFEELFTLTGGGSDDEACRRAYITALLSIAQPAAGATAGLVVIAVRGDFFERCAAYPQLAPILRDGHFVVGPMTEPELRQTITGPAATAGLQIEDGLADDILADLRAVFADELNPGAHALLSQTMLLTWRQRKGSQLTHRGYSVTGGVASAVDTSAEEAYRTLAPPQQRTAREILLRMAVIARDGRLARRQVPRAALYQHAAQPGGDAVGRVDAVLDAFVAKRLLVLSNDTAEIAHDTVLSGWPRLRSWLEDASSAAPL